MRWVGERWPTRGVIDGRVHQRVRRQSQTLMTAAARSSPSERLTDSHGRGALTPEPNRGRAGASATSRRRARPSRCIEWPRTSRRRRARTWSAVSATCREALVGRPNAREASERQPRQPLAGRVAGSAEIVAFSTEWRLLRYRHDTLLYNAARQARRCRESHPRTSAP
jgi:hypothetical protein